MHRKRPNQSSEPTTAAGTSAAEQPLVPAAVVAVTLGKESNRLTGQSNTSFCSHEHPSSEAKHLSDVATRAAGDSALPASAEARYAGLEACYRKEDSRDAVWQIHDDRAARSTTQVELRCPTGRFSRILRWFLLRHCRAVGKEGCWIERGNSLRIHLSPLIFDGSTKTGGRLATSSSTIFFLATGSIIQQRL